MRTVHRVAVGALLSLVAVGAVILGVSDSAAQSLPRETSVTIRALSRPSRDVRAYKLDDRRSYNAATDPPRFDPVLPHHPARLAPTPPTQALAKPLHHDLAPAQPVANYLPTPTTVAPAPTISMGSFQACVFLRESGRNYHVGYGGGYGILPSTWHSLGLSGVAGDASPALQDEAFARLYAMDGTSPWAPYDGC